MMRISITDRQVTVGDRVLPLTPKFFQLYCLLGLHRASGHPGFLTRRDVQRLPRWRHETMASVGKEILRHAHQMREMRGAHGALIESPPRRGTQLFRLRPPGGSIAFDVDLPAVRTFLDLDLEAPDEPPDRADRALRFLTALAGARVAFERGDLRGAREALERADRAGATGARDRVHLLLWSSRVLEREGRYRQALARADQAVAICSGGGIDYLTHARTLLWLGHLGWMTRLPEPLLEASRRYRAAEHLLEGTRHFAELAQIATGRGHLARLREDWASASQQFLAALRYAAIDGWAWGVQAALCNLGLAAMEHGDRLRGRRRDAAYRDAQQWQERCIQFADETGVGRDSTEAVSILAEILLKLGQADAARHWAAVALQRARAAGNRKSEALALECLGRALGTLGRNTEARSHLRDARSVYAEIGRNEDAQRLQDLLRRLGTAVYRQPRRSRLRIGTPRSVRERASRARPRNMHHP